ncbi:MAG: hypothetical protein QOE70_5792 [Chthoniobacter sp.]|jgi:hypothetical protein|nr:hypothetical protein [Chthoniobacter sp.]
MSFFDHGELPRNAARVRRRRQSAKSREFRFTTCYQGLPTMSTPASPDLPTIARQAMIDAGFAPEFPAEVASDLVRIASAGNAATSAAHQNLRSLLWSSIDNAESRDLDQIEVGSDSQTATSAF